MDRREFTKAMGAVVAGMAAGSRLFADEKEKAKTAADKHICAGKNECKGKGGCKTDKAACAGKNECKGKGGCAVPVRHTATEKKEKAACKGKGGCKA